MKKIFSVMAIAMAVLSCESVDMQENGNESDVMKKDVTFVMKGITVEYATRATVQSEGMTDLWVYEGSELLAHQTIGDADFGMPTVSLNYGSHDLTFVASKSEGQTFGANWMCTRVLETFGKAMNVTVSKGSATSRQVELKRVNSKVQWTIEDVVPANAGKVIIAVETCMGVDGAFNGIGRQTYTREADLTSKRGATNVVASTTILPDAYGIENDCEATITIKNDAGDVIASYSNTVAVKSNRITNIHGNLFGDYGKQTVSLLTDWDAQKDVEI